MRIAIKWGFIFAGSVILWTAAVHLLGFYTDRIEYADLVDRLATALPVACVLAALMEERGARGGSLGFGRGVATGAVLGAVAAPIVTAANWCYHHFVNPEWMTIIVTYQRQKLAAGGMAPDKVAERIALLQESAKDPAQIIGGLIGTVIICVVLALVMTPVLMLVGRMQKRGGVAAP